MTSFKEWYGVGWDSDAATDARDAWSAAVSAKKEECAKLCELLHGGPEKDYWRNGEEFAKAIRASHDE